MFSLVGRHGRRQLLRAAYRSNSSGTTACDTVASCSLWQPPSRATFATSSYACQRSSDPADEAVANEPRTTSDAAETSTSGAGDASHALEAAVDDRVTPASRTSSRTEADEAIAIRRSTSGRPSHLHKPVASTTATGGVVDATDKQQPPPPKGKAGPMQFDLASFPSLLREPHPVLDAYVRHVIPPTKENQLGGSVTIYNTPRYFSPSPPTAAEIIERGGSSLQGQDDKYLSSTTPLSTTEVSQLHRHMLKMRRVVQQTGKGRMARMSAFIVTGNGNGMVGVGEGKDENAGAASRKAFHDAVRSMDYVERLDGHTISTEMSAKWSSTHVTLRPRPPGFGLRVPPVIHAIARCAGIANLSASIRGSSNPLNVAKATLRILWGGSAPQGMGNGLSGPMRRVDRGRGLRSVRDIETARGRRLREVSAAKH